MPKIDLATAPTGEGTSYPAEYAEPCRGRRWINSVGLGTILFALGIGPLVHRTLPLFDLRRRRDARRTVSAA